jgi:hypothetical protein
MADLDALGARLERAGDAGAVAATEAEAAVIEQSISRLATDLALREATDERKPRAAILVDLLQSSPAPVRERFDRQGAEAAMARLEQLVEDLETGRLPEFDAAIPETRAAILAHLDTVHARAGENQRQRDEAQATAERLRHRWDLVAADARAAGVPLGDFTALEQKLGRLEAAVIEELFDDVAAGAAELSGRLDAAERDVDDAIDRVIERREVFKLVVAALPDLGYEIERASLKESHDGTISINASALRGDRLAVRVQESANGEPELYYSSSSLAREEAAGVQAGGACVSLVGTIDELRNRLASRGVESGEVTWEGKRPGVLPPGHQAAARPRSYQAEKGGPQ